MSTVERLPPHSVEAEEAVLGSLLIDPDAIFEVASFLRPGAFYRVQNKWIYEAILSLSERREPLDFITLTEELRRREQLEEVGGEAYIISLINAVPTSINAPSYGRLVEATALRRKMITAASTIANLAYEEAEDINVVIDRAEQALFSISEERTTRDLMPIKQIAHEYLERIEELHARGDDVIGVPTGFVDLDRLLGGLNKSDLIIVAARPGMGKCVTADTRLVDPKTGALITIEALVQKKKANLLTLDRTYKLKASQASDFVDNGRKPVYRVTTRLGREIKTTLSHPFLTINGWQPLHCLTRGDRIAVPRKIAVFGRKDAPDHEVKVLAYLIADGSLVGRSPQFTNANPRLREEFTQAALKFPGNKVRTQDSHGTRTPTIYVTQDTTFLLSNGHAYSSQVSNTLTQRLDNLGVWGKSAVEKDIPEVVYQYTRPKLALFLNRLFACDGSVYLQNKTQPVVSYASSSKALARSVQHLLLRFGIIARVRSRRMRYGDGYRKSYQVRITEAGGILKFVNEIGAFGKEEALANVLESESLHQLAQSDVYWDEIASIEPLGEQQVYDLTVSDTHNFVAEDMIVHNTSLQTAMAITAANRHDKRVAIFNLEMSGEQLVQRMISAETRIDSQRLRRGDLQEREWPIFMEAIGRLSETRIFIDDTPSITPMQLRTKCRRLYAEHGLDMVMIDYLQLMQAERSSNNRVQEISEISRGLKTLARELAVPVVAAAQLSRAVEQRQDKRPLLSDLRDSGCLTGDSLVTLANSGHRMPIRELEGKVGFQVWALNEETLRLEAATVSRAFCTGVKPVYRLTTQLGRTIRATGNHKFRTFEGWRRLDELHPGGYLAIPRLLPSPETEQTMSDSELALLGQQNVSRERAARVAAAVGSKKVARLAKSHVYWDRIVAIEAAAEEEVFDLTVPGPHNFVANNIIAHNSIEQDADIVMFIYRDEYYNPDTTERPNIAEVNVAKHRNGPTGTIDLYWHGKLATFRNLQRQEITL